jgi:two-component system, cell cycle response regulator
MQMPPDDSAEFPKANLLVIDDSDAIRKAVRKVVTDAGISENIFEGKTGLEGFRLLLNKKVDLVICDLVMPEFDGFKFLISKATRPEFNEIPVILLTSEGEMTLKVRGLEQGASDYVLKPFDDAELLARIKVHLKIKFLRDELKEKNEQLRELSGTDELTRINNRRRFMENFQTEFSRAVRYKHSMSIILFDVDHFKRVNDEHGHLSGDSVLVAIVQIMRKNLRQSDILGRWGGEELILLLPHTDATGAFHSAERIRKAVDDAEFPCDEKRLHLTVSAGIACYPRNKAEGIDDLLRQADAALYIAKSGGRNRIETAR